MVPKQVHIACSSILLFHLWWDINWVVSSLASSIFFEEILCLLPAQDFFILSFLWWNWYSSICIYCLILAAKAKTELVAWALIKLLTWLVSYRGLSSSCLGGLGYVWDDLLFLLIYWFIFYKNKLAQSIIIRRKSDALKDVHKLAWLWLDFMLIQTKFMYRPSFV